jgi:hypothetical protein
VRLRFFVERGGLLVLAFALLSLVCLHLASAGTSDGKRLEEIRSQMEKGQGFYVAGNYPAAADVFESGYKTYPYSAFLFNAGVCYQKLGDAEHALARFNEYLKVDPNAPDADKVKQRVGTLEAALAAQKAAAVPPVVDAGAAAAADAGVAPTPPTPILVPTADDQNAMKSLVVIETEPDGAPLTLYAPLDASAPPFRGGSPNPGWKAIVSTRSPANLTLDVGKYHVVIDKYRDFNPSETDIDVSPGHVHQLKADLSQGQFMAFLRVSANVTGAYVWLDDKLKQTPIWGTTPHGELVSSGQHSVLIEAPGFEPLLAPVTLSHGEQKEWQVTLSRVGYGVLRLDSNAPEFKVRVDDQPKGVWRSGEPPLDVRADAGKHRLTVSAAGRKTFDAEIDVPRGQVLPTHVKLMPKFGRGPAWTQAVLGAVVLGAAIVVGNESNRLHDQLQADRSAGVLEQTDSRATRGKWFAVGADIGFVAAGALGGLATYNFIRDPLPESTISTDKLLEFDDPMKARPTAQLPPGAACTERVAGSGPAREPGWPFGGRF